MIFNKENINKFYNKMHDLFSDRHNFIFQSHYTYYGLWICEKCGLIKYHENSKFLWQYSLDSDWNFTCIPKSCKKTKAYIIMNEALE